MGAEGGAEGVDVTEVVNANTAAAKSEDDNGNSVVNIAINAEVLVAVLR